MNKKEIKLDGCDNTKYNALKSMLRKLLTKRNQRILYVVTIFMAALSIIDAVKNIFPLPVSIAVYVCAAVSFFSSCALWIRTVRILIKVVLIPFTERNKIIGIFIRDYKLRTVITAVPGLGITFAFAVFNAVLGIARSSAWYGSLAAYYISLCIMRFIAVMYAKSIYIDKHEVAKEFREIKVYKNCGITISVMSISLMGAVIVLLDQGVEKSYPGFIIYVMAAYGFYKFVTSIINMVKAKKERSLLSITLRNIIHCEALVSILSLQIALFTAFGKNAGAMVPIMNAATGGAVCLGTLVIGIYMTADSWKKKQLYIKTNGGA